MQGSYLKNHFLIAMPQMLDPYFEKTVTLICDHNEDGAMGIIINRPIEMQFSEILDQLEMPISDYNNDCLEQPILMGGPVAQENGLILHAGEKNVKDTWASTLRISENIYLTTSQDILSATAAGHGPNQQQFALGYSGWDSGQLEEEIKSNSWLIAPADYDIIFACPFEQRWDAATRSLGIDPNRLSHSSGHA